MGTIYTANMSVIIEECWSCGVTFGLGQGLKSVFVRDGATFYCPRGCRLRYGDSTESQLRAALAKKDEELVQKSRVVEQSRQAAIDARLEAQGQRLKAERLARKVKRANAGICLDCNRTFRNVQRHRATKHSTVKS